MKNELQASSWGTADTSPEEIEEISAYDAHTYGHPDEKPRIPLENELFVEIWTQWEARAQEEGAFAVLARHLPQLRFPIREGMKQNDDYRAATLRGVDPDTLSEATGLEPKHPEKVELVLHASPAGKIPLIISRDREAFEILLRALLRRNEPVEVPPGQGASMVAGYNNWHRIHALQRAWLETPEGERERATWGEEFAAIRQDKSRFQDRFILLSDGPYSAVPAADLGLDEEQWREMSLVIRREHECTHYFTRRVFGAMKNHLLDELMADYAGLTAATGRFHSDWFLRFLGLEDLPNYREGTRIEIYRGDPKLSDGAFRVLHRIMESAARNVEAFDRERWPEASHQRTLAERAGMILALGGMTLTQIAAEDGTERLARAFEATLSS